MQENHIFLSELAVLGLWLAAPAFIVGLGLQGLFLWRSGLGRPGRRRRMTLALLASAVLSYILMFGIWISVPERFMIWPGSFGDGPFMFLGVFLVPAVLALVVVCPSTTWCALRERRSSPTSGCS